MVTYDENPFNCLGRQEKNKAPIRKLYSFGNQQRSLLVSLLTNASYLKYLLQVLVRLIV